MSLVFIERSEGYERAFEATLRLLEKSKVSEVLPPRNILVKPNLVTADGSREGITTDVSIVDAILHFLKEQGCGNLTVGEGCGAGPTHTAFKINGYPEVARKHGVHLVDLDTSEGIELDVPHPLSVKRLRIAKVAYEADFRISVAKLKVHSIGVMTGCLKNMMGCLSGKKWKLVVHADVQKRIIDLNRLVKPHFGIVDGIIGNEVEECDPNPVPMNILIGGNDCVSVDAVSAECMGIGWNEVPHLVMAEREGLGTADIDKIQVSGENVEKIRKKFERKSGPWTYIRTRSEIIAGKIFGSIRR
jgi:uncharacterized protein (DUF362 family)